MEEAEHIARTEHGSIKIAVISGEHNCVCEGQPSHPHATCEASTSANARKWKIFLLCLPYEFRSVNTAEGSARASKSAVSQNEQIRQILRVWTKRCLELKIRQGVEKHRLITSPEKSPVQSVASYGRKKV